MAPGTVADGQGRPDDAGLAEAFRQTSVIIPVKDDVRVISCIDSIDEEVEVVLALNGASLEIREISRTHPRKPVSAEIAEANLGAAYNAGAEKASGRYLLFMDSDCQFAPGTIRALVRGVVRHSVVKGRVKFTAGRSALSRFIQDSRTYQIADHINAYSPPLIYDRTIIPMIGGYHYSSLIHWEEDREFDFRLQLADVTVVYLPDAVVHHAAQDGFSDLRSGFRYGIGEGIGQELGLFITPSLRWRLRNDMTSVTYVARRRSLATALYRTTWLTSYHLGTLYHHWRDPYGVRAHYPPSAQRIRVRNGVPGHTTKLEDRHKDALRIAHLRAGRVIEPIAHAITAAVPTGAS
jgi:glycosyltransferase involved in cell wall biosynthesis